MALIDEVVKVMTGELICYCETVYRYVLSGVHHLSNVLRWAGFVIWKGGEWPIYWLHNIAETPHYILLQQDEWGASLGKVGQSTLQHSDNCKQLV